MCLIILAHHIRPHLPLIVIANRDEFFNRPTESAAFWKAKLHDPEILAGKDLEANGTWLGITRNGKFAAVTNMRETSQKTSNPISRGQLPLEFLSSKKSPIKFATELTAKFPRYSGFNLLLADKNSLIYLNSSTKSVSELQPGIYGLSNGLLNANWPKINQGKKQLKNLINKDIELTTDSLISMLSDRSIAPDEFLPNTGISIELERQLSSSFVTIPERHYGTLCSTAVIISRDGLTRFDEQSFDEAGNPAKRQYFEFYSSL
tara:strand:- start:990 stop:1775 length:786 start_codon:yes stop_codon:yes gene_type:complete